MTIEEYCLAGMPVNHCSYYCKYRGSCQLSSALDWRHAVFSNTVNLLKAGGGELDASLISVSDGKSVRRINIDATTTLEFRLATAKSKENSPAGSNRYLIRCDVIENVIDGEGKSVILTSSAYLVLVKPVADTTGLANGNLATALTALLSFTFFGDNAHADSLDINGLTPAGACIGAGDMTVAGKTLTRLVRGEL